VPSVGEARAPLLRALARLRAARRRAARAAPPQTAPCKLRRHKLTLRRHKQTSHLQVTPRALTTSVCASH
jgi:hypothetical protein